MRRLTVLFLLVLSVLTVYAETEKGAQITGKVIDASTKQGMEFANISLRKTGSKEFINRKKPLSWCWIRPKRCVRRGCNKRLYAGIAV